MEKERALKIIIIGGGLVGAAAAIAFSKLPNVRVAVYEKAPSPHEIGESIGVTDSGMQVLNDILNISDIEPILYRGVTAERHWKYGDIIGTKRSSSYRKPKLHGGRCLRTDLHEKLLKFVPLGIISYGYNASSVNIFSDHAEVCFSHIPERISADLVIAADGIHSKIRQQFYPESGAQYRGIIAYRSIVPLKLVQDIPGLPDENCIYPGKTGVCFLTKVGNSGIYNVGAQLQEPFGVAERFTRRRRIEPDDLERIRQRLEGWNPFVSQVFDRVSVEHFKAYPLESAPWLKNLVMGDRLAFIGDAAHPTSGAYGSGANFGFNDVWVLYQALLRSLPQELPEKLPHYTHNYNIPWALSIFNKTRTGVLNRIEKQLSLDAIKRKYIWSAQNDQEYRSRYKEVNHRSLSWLYEHDPDIDLENNIVGG